MSRNPASKHTVTVEGEDIPVTFEMVPLGEVKLDGDNPRTRQQIGAKGPLSQEQLRELILELPGVSSLLKTIRENKGLQEPIYIRSDGRVAEGNCRTAIYLRLNKAREHEAEWKAIPAYRLPADITERQVAVLQGNWHVSGKNNWRRHEQAGHLHYMANSIGMTTNDIAVSTGLSETEVKRLIAAYELMRSEVLPKVKNGDGLKLFSYAYEFQKSPHLADYRKTKTNQKEFGQLVASGKIGKGKHVRDLHKILAHSAAHQSLKSDGYQKAIAQVGKTDPSADFPIVRKLASTAKAIRELRTTAIDRIKKGSNERKAVQDLYRALKDLADNTGVTLK